MTYELIERTVRDWALGNPALGARDLARLTGQPPRQRRSPNQVADDLVELAGRLYIDRTRDW
jgi:hypothetical protein